uniref:Uncharacterized protein n=1 Tax=Oryza punctata TaxID=4537 RepID=A0A0E0KS39_ORYPU
MTQSTKIKYCHADSGNGSGNGSKPLSAETKTHLIADGKKIHEEKNDGTAIRPGSGVLIHFTILVIRFLLLVAMHYYHIRTMAKLQGIDDVYVLFVTCRHYIFMAGFIITSCMGF